MRRALALLLAAPLLSGRPDEGYLFVTNRGDEAVFAATRLRAVSPGANITFVSDAATLRDVGNDLDVFDVVLPAEAAMPDLDAARADVACVMGGRGNHTGASAGVLANARTPAAAALWRNWERVYRTVMASTRREQPSFQKAMAARATTASWRSRAHGLQLPQLRRRHSGRLPPPAPAPAAAGGRPPVVVAIARHPRDRYRAAAALPPPSTSSTVPAAPRDCFEASLGLAPDADVNWFCGGDCGARAGERAADAAFRRADAVVVLARRRRDGRELERALPSHFRLGAHVKTARRLSDDRGVAKQMRHAGGATLPRAHTMFDDASAGSLQLYAAIVFVTYAGGCGFISRATGCKIAALLRRRATADPALDRVAGVAHAAGFFAAYSVYFGFLVAAACGGCVPNDVLLRAQKEPATEFGVSSFIGWVHSSPTLFYVLDAMLARDHLRRIYAGRVPGTMAAGLAIFFSVGQFWECLHPNTRAPGVPVASFPK
ncbi:hypothetical protein JL722_13671 [Aureococcus anophagefferens]|nr:hypothetical protein JL722_13671 [Aureococcus anophagefferens]